MRFPTFNSAQRILTHVAPGDSVKESTCQSRRCVFNPLVGNIPLEKEMATHSSILTWKIPWIKGPGRLQSMGLQRVRHDWACPTSVSFSLQCPFSFSCIQSVISRDDFSNFLMGDHLAPLSGYGSLCSHSFSILSLPFRARNSVILCDYLLIVCFCF